MVNIARALSVATRASLSSVMVRATLGRGAKVHRAGLGGITDSELEDRLFTYPWLSLHTPKAYAARVAQLIRGSGAAWPGGDRRKSPRQGRVDPGCKGRVMLLSAARPAVRILWLC